MDRRRTEELKEEDIWRRVLREEGSNLSVKPDMNYLYRRTHHPQIRPPVLQSVEFSKRDSDLFHHS